MKLVDSHCHLDFEPLSNELEGVIERAGKSGVFKMINIGSSLRGSEKSVEIANLYPNIWASVGIHPHDAGEIMDFDGTMEKIKELSKNDQVVAIGEIGLDYFTGSSEKGTVSREKKEEQKKLFVTQLEIAKEANLPVVIHVRDAWDDFFSTISNFKFQISNSPKAVVHCFTGDEEIAQKLLDLGLYIGFTGFITFDQSKFDHIREAVKITPIDRILIETDAPFLSPEPFRGKTNEPAYVKYVAEKIAELKGLSIDEVASVTSKNAKKLFDI